MRSGRKFYFKQKEMYIASIWEINGNQIFPEFDLEKSSEELCWTIFHFLGELQGFILNL